MKLFLVKLIIRIKNLIFNKNRHTGIVSNSNTNKEKPKLATNYSMIDNQVIRQQPENQVSNKKPLQHWEIERKKLNAQIQAQYAALESISNYCDNDYNDWENNLKLYEIKKIADAALTQKKFYN